MSSIRIVSPELHTTILPAQPELMMPFLREAYGENYRGDDVINNFFERIDKVVGLQNQIGAIAAVALIEGVSANRIIAGATSPNFEDFGSRSKLLTQVYRECHERSNAAWMSIGTEYDKVQRCAGDAGLARVEEVPVITKILTKAQLETHYDIGFDPDNRPVIITNEGAGKGKVQQVWAWPDRLNNISTTQ